MGFKTGRFGGDTLADEGQYKCLVNKNSLNVGQMANLLNEQYEAGYRLHTALEQNGNTVIILERM
jgi:hypothetical protein